MIGALGSVEGRVSWPYAGYEVCDRTTIVLVGRQMPSTNPVKDHIDGCEVRHVRGEWNSATLEKGLPDERERRPDLVLLYNADAYTCPWRRTLHALLQPREDLRHSIGADRLMGGPSGAPVVVTTYAANEAQAIQRIVSNPEEWFAEDKLEECDALVRTIYGDDERDKNEEAKEAKAKAKKAKASKGGEAVDSESSGSASLPASSSESLGVSSLPMPRPALLHWRAGPNDPEDNAPGTPNSHWISFAPGESSSEKGPDRHMPTVQRDWHLSGAAVLILIVGLAVAAARQTARRWMDENPKAHARIRARRERGVFGGGVGT